MNARTRLALSALFFIMLLGAVTATAQPITWNGPCLTIRVKDATGLTVGVNVVTNPPGVVGTLVAPPFGASPTIVLPAPPAPATIVTGITSLGGVFYPIIQPGPPSPPAPFGTGWIPNVTIAPGICADLYFDIPNCTIYVYPTTFLPPCRP